MATGRPLQPKASLTLIPVLRSDLNCFSKQFFDSNTLEYAVSVK